MEKKKSESVELEGGRTTRLMIGVIVMLAVMFVAFEWTEYGKSFETSAGGDTKIVESTLAPVTYQEVKPPPPPTPVVIEELIILDDTLAVEPGTFESLEETGQAVEIGRYKPVEIEKEEEEEPLEDEIFELVEKMPEFPGGMRALVEFLRENIEYPPFVLDGDIQGRVFVKFVIEKDGTVTDPTVTKSIGSYYDKEALRVVSSMPKWIPGMQGNKPVRVWFTVPVVYRLR